MVTRVTKKPYETSKACKSCVLDGGNRDSEGYIGPRKRKRVAPDKS